MNNNTTNTTETPARCQPQGCAGSRSGACVWPMDTCASRGVACTMKPIIDEENAKNNTEARRALRALDGAIRTLSQSRSVLERVLGDR
jgi:hypothetical protein